MVFFDRMTRFTESERSGERLPTAAHRMSKGSQFAGMHNGLLILHKHEVLIELQIPHYLKSSKLLKILPSIPLDSKVGIPTLNV